MIRFNLPCFSLFCLTLSQAFTSITIEIDSLAALADYAKRDNVNVRLLPGTYDCKLLNETGTPVIFSEQTENCLVIINGALLKDHDQKNETRTK